MTGKLFTLSCAALMLAGAAQAQSANRCAPRDQVIAQLADRYGETRQSIGLGSNNSVIEVYASGDTGTWTILATLPNGLSCLLASGQAYEALAGVQPAQGTRI
ncbi:hypothetical protein [Thalassovita mangrovi]|uniref:Uncharacterized protein n=1 Tax=Thalassovita mangrovi TaxID=2692236 RepID=A0A6L8LLW7_9RHOB|nr:hypothetical protein [Thalassovita mangrovi]MYM57018.1 hypothetical protein [Thalassovita mangrovi]